MPKTMQSKFTAPLKQILEKEIISEMNKVHIQKLLVLSIHDESDNGSQLHLTELFCRLLKLNKLKEKFSVIGKKNSNRVGGP